MVWQMGVSPRCEIILNLAVVSRVAVAMSAEMDRKFPP